MTYSEKEIAIFNGFIQLIKEGRSPYTIKVSDIAKAANIGKGTLYDYFSSKEEAISMALYYFIDREVHSICERIKSKNTFKEKFYEILFIITENLERNISTINVFLSTGNIHEFYRCIEDERFATNKMLNLLNNVMEHLLETGYTEGIINAKHDKFYQMMAMRGSLSGFSHYLSRRSIYKGITLEKAMDTAYKLLLKTLS